MGGETGTHSCKCYPEILARGGNKIVHIAEQYIFFLAQTAQANPVIFKRGAGEGAVFDHFASSLASRILHRYLFVKKTRY